jgi:hypothetical protein
MADNKDPSGPLTPIPTNSPEVTEAFRILNDATNQDVPKMTERMFVEHILPMLSAPAGTKVDLSRWLDVAGTPLRAIDVHDDNTGELLFRVPPLMRTLPTVFQSEVNYGEIVTNAQAKARIAPAMGQHHLANELAKVRTGAALLDVETAKLWNRIRKRYNLPLLTIVDRDGSMTDTGTVDSTPSDGQLSISDEDEPLF